jgi:poly(3-hydroxybutyrate) depolymerase
VQIWVGTAKKSDHGPLLLYWHDLGSSSTEAVSFFGQAQIDAITALGGMVASFTNSLGTGTNSGNFVWFTDDFNTADEVVACAMANLHIDTRHINTAGARNGGLQATYMAYARSGYIAASAPISGGLHLGLIWTDPIDTPQDPSNVPSAIVSHGAPGVDVGNIAYQIGNQDFAVDSAGYEADIKKHGGFSVDCNTQGGSAGSVGTAALLGPTMWEFMRDHPFKVWPDPYANGLPSDFWNGCAIGPRAADGGAP